MGMTILRWCAGVVLACAAIASLLLPFPALVPDRWSSPAPASLAAEVGKLTVAAHQAHAAARTYRSAQALDRWKEATRNADTTLVRIDRSVPNAAARAVRAVVAEQWAGLGTAVSAAHAEVFVYFDSTSIPRSRVAAESPRAVLETRRLLVDVAFALPPATDGQRCVTLVRLRGLSPAHIGAMRSQGVIGVCGFFASFGIPGASVQAWLATTSYRFARRSDWSVARAPATDASAVYSLSGPAGRCLTGDAAGCLSALGITGSPAALGRPPEQRLAWVLDAAMPTSAAVSNASPISLGDAGDALLADAVRSVGVERFGQFWTSRAQPESGFVAATGMGLDTWTQRWLARAYGTAPEKPTPRLGDLLWLATVLPLALFVAARPRQRVLAERLFASRA